MSVPKLAMHLSAVSRKLKEIEQSAPAAGNAAKDAGDALADFLVLHKEWKKIAEKPLLVGRDSEGGVTPGMIDMQHLVHLVRKLRDPKLDAIERSRGETELRAIEQTIRKFADPSFVVDSFVAALNRFDRQQAGAARPSRPAGGTTSAGLRVRLNHQGGSTAVVDVLPDSGDEKGGKGTLSIDLRDNQDELRRQITQTKTDIEKAVKDHSSAKRIEELKTMLEYLLRAVYGTAKPSPADVAKIKQAGSTQQTAQPTAPPHANPWWWLVSTNQVNG